MCRIAFAPAQGEVGCGGITGGMEGPDAKREGQNEKGTGKGGRGAGGTRSREGESEEGGWKRWRGGEVNAPRGNATHAARQAIRGPMSESTFYRALRSFSFSLPLLPDSRRGCHTHTHTLACAGTSMLFFRPGRICRSARLCAVRDGSTMPRRVTILKTSRSRARFP